MTWRATTRGKQPGGFVRASLQVAFVECQVLLLSGGHFEWTGGAQRLGGRNLLVVRASAQRGQAGRNGRVEDCAANLHGRHVHQHLCC